MAPFSASPLAVQLSGFVSRHFLVAKCAHPAQERTRGFAALHRLYRAAGFCESDLTALPNLFADIYILLHCGKISCSSEVFASPSHVSLTCGCITYTVKTMFHQILSMTFQLVHPQIRSHLHCRTSPASRDGFFISYYVNSIQEPVFSNFFTMYTMRIFYYIEQWPYSRQHSFPTLNQHLYPAQTYGTNLKDFDRTTLTRPMPSLTRSTSLRLTSLREEALWMSCWNLIFQNHINTLLPLHLTPFQIHRSSQPPHRRLRNANRMPKLLPRHLQNVVAVPNNRDPAPRARCRRGLSKTNKNFVP